MMGVSTPEAAETFAHLHAADFREAQVDQDQAGFGSDCQVQPSLAVARQRGSKAFAFKQHGDRVAQTFVIVDYQDGLHRQADFSLPGATLEDAGDLQ